MNDRKQANLDRINELWELHKHHDEEAATVEGRCLAFVIDPRYIEGEHWPGTAVRLAVSFGHPVVGSETKQGLVALPVHPGKFVFGLHGIRTKGNQLTRYGEWQEALDAGGCTDPVQAEAKARAILEAISDEDYIWRASSPDYDGPVRVSSVYLLEDFEVLQGWDPWTPPEALIDNPIVEARVPHKKLDLSRFIGGTKFYRHWNGRLTYTEGIAYLEKQAGASWLIDAIASYQADSRIRTAPMLQGFQLWRLTLDGKGGASLTCWADRENEQRPVVAQEVENTDFPEDIKLYVENGRLMLPSER
jgi:hypothetical protein